MFWGAKPGKRDWDDCNIDMNLFTVGEEDADDRFRWLWPPLKGTAQHFFFQHRTFLVLCCFCFWVGLAIVNASVWKNSKEEKDTIVNDYRSRFSIKVLENCDNVEKCLSGFIYLFVGTGCLLSCRSDDRYDVSWDQQTFFCLFARCLARRHLIHMNWGVHFRSALVMAEFAWKLKLDCCSSGGGFYILSCKNGRQKHLSEVWQKCVQMQTVKILWQSLEVALRTMC